MKESKKIRKLKAITKAYSQLFLLTISKKLDKPLNRPTSIAINVTNNCNSHCRHCHLWQSKPEKQLNLDQGKKIIDKLYHWLGCYYLFFTGGEPFINQDLPEIIKYAQKKGVICHVNSNAFLIENKLASKIIDSKLDSLSISLDGSKPKTHDYIRNTPNAYKKVINALKILQQKNGPKIYLNTVIMRQNISELTRLIKFCQRGKINGLNFQCLLPTLATTDTTKDLKNSFLWPKYNQVKSEIKKIIDLNDSQKTKLNADDARLKQIISYYKNPTTNTKTTCAAGINNYIIDNNGDVRLCFDMAPIGNIFNDSAKKIWLSNKAQQQRKIIRKCQKLCKITACNKADINRQINVDSRDFTASE